MKRATVLLVAAGILLAAGPARGDQTWTQNQHATNLATGAKFSLDGLPAPVLGKFSPLRLDDLTLCAGGPLWVNATGLPFRCATIGNTASGADLQAPLAPADGSIVMPTAGTIRVGTVPGTGVTGTPNTAAWFNGSGVLNSLTLAPEFGSIVGGTLSIAAGGITTVKLADAAVTYAKIQNVGAGKLLGNPTGSPAPPSEIAPVAPLAFSGTNFQLNIDASLNVAGGLLQRNALTGAVTAAAGSNTTAFGEAPALSALVNATNGSAVPSFVGPAGANQALMGTPAGTGVAWQTVPGASVRADGIATGTIQLASLAAASLADGTIAYVDSVGDYFKLVQAALTTDGLTIVAASGRSGFQWHRMAVPSVAWASQASWFIDPSSGNDEAIGSTNATAIKTLQELRRRWWGAALPSSVTVTILGNIPSTDTGSWNFTVKPGTRVTFAGTLGATTGFGSRAIDNTIYTGSVSTFTAGSDAPGATDVEFSDSSLPTSFSASGLTASGVLFARTNGTAKYWYLLKQLSAKTARITAPQADALTLSFSAATLTAGDAYAAYKLWTMPTQNFNVGTTGFGTQDTAGTAAIVLQQIDDTGTVFPLYNGMAIGTTPNRRRTWVDLTTRSRFSIGSTLSNSMYELSSGGFVTASSTTLVPTQIQGGGVRGGSGSTLVLFGVLGIGAGPFSSEGVQIRISDGGYLTIQSPIGFHDCTGTALTASFYATVELALSSAGGLSGVGNTGRLIDSIGGGHIIYDASTTTPPISAASTTSSTPVQIGPTAYAVSQLPAVTDTTLTNDAPFPSILFETSGPTALTVGAVANGQLVQRSGSSLVGASATGFLADSGSNGIVVRTGPGTTTSRTLSNTDGTLAITNPDGVAGNPIINTTGLTPSSRTVTGTAPINIAGDHAAHDLSANRTWGLDTNGVTNSLLAQMPAGTIKGNNMGGAVNALDLTATQVTAMLDPFTSSLKGLAPGSGGGTTNFLRADGNWATPPSGATGAAGGALTGTYPNPSIATGVIVGANFANFPADTLFGNPTGSPAAPTTIPLGTGLSFVGSALTVTVAGGADALGTYWVSSATHAPANAVNWGLLGNGVHQQTTSGSVATPGVFTSTPQALVFGAATGGGLATDTNFSINPSTHFFTATGSVSLQGATTTIGAWNGVGTYVGGVVGAFSVGGNLIPYGSGAGGGLTQSTNLSYPGGALTITSADSNGNGLYLNRPGTQQLTRHGGIMWQGTDDLNPIQYFVNNSSVIGGWNTGGSFFVQNMAGVGTRCAHVDSAGVFSPTASDCGSGGGSVTGVTASAPLASSGGTAPNITLTYGNGLSNVSGTLSNDLHTGVSGGQSVVGGNASGNALTLTSNTSHDGNIFLGISGTVGVLNELGRAAFGQTTVDAAFHVALSNNSGTAPAPLGTTAWDSKWAVFGAQGSTGGALGISRSTGGQVYVSALSPSVAWQELYVGAHDFQFYSDGTTAGFFQDSSGHIGAATLSAGGVVVAAPGTGQLGVSPALVASLYYTTRLYTLLNGGELVQGGYSLNPLGAISITQVEYPANIAASHVTLTCNYEHATVTSGTYTLRPARNGVDTSIGVSITPGTTTGTYTTSTTVSSPATSDTWGLDVTSVGTANNCDPSTSNCPDILCSILLTP